MKWNHFTNEEVQNLEPQLVMMLDQARDIAGIPFIITSGFRDKDKNQAVGGVQDSAHLRGLAVDLKVKNSIERFKIQDALLKIGFNRIGHYTAHIHADIDPSLPQRVIWLDDNI